MSESSPAPMASPGLSTDGPQWFGHPRGLATLFMTEMWERLSYYGMRALLVLFMTDAARGGFAMDASFATAAYGLYTFGVYALALPGGWIADRLIGKKKSVLYGGIIIALGHYCLFIDNTTTFFFGLFLVVVGTGLLKPNVSTVVGDLYPEGGARRDAGFSLFYSGINLGAFLGQVICPLLGEKYDWHLGFGFAALGMTIGVIQYYFGQKHLEGAGDLSAEAEASRPAAMKMFWLGLIGFLAVLALSYWLLSSGQFSLIQFVDYTGVIVVVLSIAFFAYSIVFSCRNNLERKRVGVIALLFLGAAVFWSGFEQSGTSMTLFARDYTDRMIFGWEFPAGGLQSVNAILIILLAPVMGALWLKLGARNPSIPVKFGLGLVLLGLAFWSWSGLLSVSRTEPRLECVGW